MNKILGLIRKFENLFDQTYNDVPLGRRFGAYAIDWAVGGICAGFPAVLLYAALTKSNDMFSNLYVFEALGYEWYWGIVAGLLCVLFALFYYVYIPWKLYPGQTLGKKIAGLRIVKVNDEEAGLKELLIRHAFAMFILESSAFVISSYIQQMVTLVTRFYVESYWGYIGIFFTLISVMMIANTRSHRGLHDYIAKTKVIMATANQGNEKPMKKELPVKPKEVKKKPKADIVENQPKEKQRLPKKNKPKK